MSHTVAIELEVPKDWRQFRLPPALHARLHEWLDRQDHTGRLFAKERREAQALTELVDILALKKARAAVGRHPTP